VSSDNDGRPALGDGRVSRHRIDGVEVVSFSGELDLYHRDELRDCLERAFEERLPVVLDLQGCEFIDSSGIAVLFHASRKLNGGWGLGFSLASAQDGVQRVLKVTGVDRVIDSYLTREDAISALTANDR
jgi:anti-anti-sigma factor